MKCPLCSKTRSCIVYRFDGATIRKCSSCTFIFSTVQKGRPRVDKSYWNAPNKEFYDYYYQSRLAGLHRYYLKLLKHYGVDTVLDIGAGLGYFVFAARDAEFRIEGYEPGNVGRDFARTHLKTRLRASMPKKKYDGITMFHTLEHIPNAKQFVRKLKTHLIHDGIILVEVPNQGSFLNRIRGKQGYDPYAHVNFFTKRTLQQLFIDQNFEIVSLKTRQSRRTTLFLSLIPFKQSQRQRVESGGTETSDFGLYKLVGVIDVLFSPVRLLLSILGQGDELVLVARKR